jgi:hypothetical protein
VGRSRAAVTNLLRLLDLSEEVQQLVRDRKLDMGHARALLPLPPALQREAAHQVLLRGLSARETESLVRRLRQADARAVPASEAADPDIRRCKTICRSGWAHGFNCGTIPRARGAWSSTTTRWTSWMASSPVSSEAAIFVDPAALNSL